MVCESKRPVAPVAEPLADVEVPFPSSRPSVGGCELAPQLEDSIIHDEGDKSTGDPACDYIDNGTDTILDHTDAAWADGFRAGWRKALESGDRRWEVRIATRFIVKPGDLFGNFEGTEFNERVRKIVSPTPDVARARACWAARWPSTFQRSTSAGSACTERNSHLPCDTPRDRPHGLSDLGRRAQQEQARPHRGVRAAPGLTGRRSLRHAQGRAIRRGTDVG